MSLLDLLERDDTAKPESDHLSPKSRRQSA
jgi:hypothetical protein